MSEERREGLARTGGVADLSPARPQRAGSMARPIRSARQVIHVPKFVAMAGGDHQQGVMRRGRAVLVEAKMSWS